MSMIALLTRFLSVFTQLYFRFLLMININNKIGKNNFGKLVLKEDMYTAKRSICQSSKFGEKPIIGYACTLVLQKKI